MQPAYQPQIIPNNFSPELVSKRNKWAESQGIKGDEMLCFVALGTGNTKPLMVKSTAPGMENNNSEPMPTSPASFCIPSHETIADPNTPGGFVQLIHYDGGYFPGKAKSPVMFSGYQEPVINVVPEENPALYDFLTLSPRLQDGPLKTRLAPKYRLMRPDNEADANFDDDQKFAAVILAIGDASMDTLSYLAPKLFLPSDVKSESRMRKNFSDYVKIRPANVEKLQQLFEADETLIYQQVEEAVSADIVAVDKDKAVWVLTNNQAPITAANPEKNNIDQLVGYLMLESGQTTLKQIIALLGNAQIEPGAKRKGGRPKSNA